MLLNPFGLEITTDDLKYLCTVDLNLRTRLDCKKPVFSRRGSNVMIMNCKYSVLCVANKSNFLLLKAYSFLSLK